MFTAVVLMCTIDMACYTIVNENGFFASDRECRLAIKELISSEEFDPIYRRFEAGSLYNVYSVECINWEKTEI